MKSLYAISQNKQFCERVAHYYAQLLMSERRVEFWKAFDRRTEAQQQEFRAGLRKLFRAQKQAALARLSRYERYWLPVMTKATVDDLVFDDDEMEYWRVRFSEYEQLLLPDVVEQAGDRAVGTVVTGISFDVTNPRVTDYIDSKTFKFSFEVNKTTLSHLRTEFAAGLAEGEGIPQLRKRVEKVFGFADKYRSERIARTEIIGANNFGAFEGYRQSGVVEMKEWLSTQDARVRDSHAAIDGERVGLHEVFSNGLMYPGDMSGPPDEVINCRCTILPVTANA